MKLRGGPHSVCVMGTLLTLKQEVQGLNPGAAPTKSLEPVPLPTQCTQNESTRDYEKNKINPNLILHLLLLVERRDGDPVGDVPLLVGGHEGLVLAHVGQGVAGGGHVALGFKI